MIRQRCLIAWRDWGSRVILADVNVLVYAFRRDTERHAEYRGWLWRVLREESAVGYAEPVLGSVVRIVTHPRIFAKPSTVHAALGFCRVIRSRPNTVRVAPGDRHWSIFTDLCRSTNARGNLVAEAYLAALAIKHGAVWMTADRHFARYKGLRWRHPLDR